MALLAAFWCQILVSEFDPAREGEVQFLENRYFTLIVKASETFPRKAFKRTRAGWISAYFIASAGRRALT